MLPVYDNSNDSESNDLESNDSEEHALSLNEDQLEATGRGMLDDELTDEHSYEGDSDNEEYGGEDDGESF